MQSTVVREARVGVFDVEKPTEVICYRHTKTHEARVVDAMGRENRTKEKPLTRSSFVALVADLGLALYEALEDTRPRFDAVRARERWTWTEGVRAVWDAGLKALEKSARR